jgi:uncharacterized protein (TIGR03437 family)
VAILLGNGDGTFRPAISVPAGAYANGIAVADFNGDGIADIVVADYTGDLSKNQIEVLIGKGDGTFRPAVTYATGVLPLSVAAADFNGDGFADVAVANSSSNTVSVLLGNGDGTFKPAVNYAAGKGVLALAVADVNADGHADLAVVNHTDNTVSILLGNGNGTFRAAVNYQTGQNPQSVAVADVNSDGVSDLVTSNGGDNSVSVLVGKGDGTFAAPISYKTANSPVQIVVGDFNQDGREDVAVGYLLADVGVLLGVPGAQIASVLNAASLANTGLSPGLIFVVNGSALGPAAAVTSQPDANGLLPTKSSGVQVLVDSTPAPLLAVQQNQISAIAPYELDGKAGSNVNVQVIYNGVVSAVFSVGVVTTAPAIFPAWNGQSAILNEDGSINSADNPAAQSSIISILATGEGQLIPAGVDGQAVTDTPGQPAAVVSATIGGLDAQIQYLGSSQFDGLLQVQLVLPDGVTGVAPIVLTIGGQQSQAGINIIVE